MKKECKEASDTRNSRTELYSDRLEEWVSLGDKPIDMELNIEL